MTTWSASEALIVVHHGRPVLLDERYRRMLERLLAAIAEMDASRAGTLTLHYNGDGVTACVAPVCGRSRRAASRGSTPQEEPVVGPRDLRDLLERLEQEAQARARRRIAEEGVSATDAWRGYRADLERIRGKLEEAG